MFQRMRQTTCDYVLTGTIKVVGQHSGTGFLCCTFKCFSKEATTTEQSL